ncbi:hypothetical protein HMPREF3034_01357 [Prevotella sp. DNF00663]|nr:MULTISPECIES: gliding motility protein GldB [unclassified Prevotella]KGI59608.1 gliding motility protein GldB [Prevotella sp. S7 MS 2]KXB83119.1 hypothetical protein HMPREF3034_01357 [Prevotella sp. DNF00663]
MWLCSACEFKFNNTDEKDHRSIAIHRFDRLESRYLTTGDFSALQQMNTDYPIETRTLIENVLNLGDVNESDINSRLLNYFQDALLQDVILAVDSQYVDMSDISKLMYKAFRRLGHAIPSIPIPEIYTQIGAFNQSIVVGDGMIGISLDKYLGNDFGPYAKFYNQQQRATMTRENIVPDCISFYLLSYYPAPMGKNEKETLRLKAVHMGKVMWAANKLTDSHIFQTAYVDRVEQFMKKHKNLPIKQLMELEDGGFMN